eukprot:scaffold844_cov139-Isochrysis_galbana.AAC.8
MPNESPPENVHARRLRRELQWAGRAGEEHLLDKEGSRTPVSHQEMARWEDLGIVHMKERRAIHG